MIAVCEIDHDTGILETSHRTAKIEPRAEIVPFTVEQISCNDDKGHPFLESAVHQVVQCVSCGEPDLVNRNALIARQAT